MALSKLIDNCVRFNLIMLKIKLIINLFKYVMILLVNMMNIKSYYQQNISLSFMFPS